MNAPNHIAFGIGFTAISCSFLDVNIYEPAALAVTVSASLISDLDHPSSLTGRLVPPLSKKLNRQFGHRTLTHSVFFLAATTAIAHFFGFGLIWFFALLSHIIGDMVTRAGVAFLYPFSSNRWVIPGERKWRLKSGDNKAELAVFVLSCALCIATLDLAQVGIKSTFHRTFKTFSHTKSEAEKKRIFVETANGSGEVVQVNSKELILFDGENFRKLDEKTSIADVREGGKFEVKKVEFKNISADSLRRFRNILKGEIQCNHSFNWKDGVLEKSGKLAKVKVLPYFDFKEPILEDNSIELLKLNTKLDAYKEVFADEMRQYNRKMQEFAALEQNFNDLSDYEKGKAIKTLKNREKMAIPVQNPKIKEILAQIALLELEKPEKTVFSGTFQLVKRSKSTNSDQKTLAKLPF